MSRAHFLVKFLFVFIIACTLGLWWMQHDQRCIAFAQKSMEQMFDKELHASFNGIVTKIDIPRLSVTYKHVVVTPHDVSLGWQWKADELCISLSLLSYLYQKSFGFFITVKNVAAQSLVVNYYPRILDHMYAMVKAPPMILPLVFDGIVFTHSTLDLKEEKENWRLVASFQSDIGRSGKILKGRLSLLDAALYYKKQILFEKMEGVCSTSLDYVSGKNSAQWDSTLVIPSLPDDQQTCYFSGNWQHNKADAVLYNHQRTCSIVPLTLIKHLQGWHITSNGLFALSACKKMFFDFLPYDIQGMLNFSIQGDTDKTIYGSFGVQNFSCNTYCCDTAQSSFMYHVPHTTIRGTTHIQHNNQIIQGAYEYNQAQDKGFCFLYNKTNVHLPEALDATILTGDFQCAVQKSLSQILFLYGINAVHNKTQERNNVAGTVQFLGANIELQGVYNDYNYTLCADRATHVVQQALCQKQNEKKSYAHCVRQKNNTYDLKITDVFLTDMAKKLGYEVAGLGSVEGHITACYPHVYCTIQSCDNALRLCDMHNFITQYTARISFDLSCYKATFLKVLVMLSQGTCTLDNGWVQWHKDKKYMAYIPFECNNCFLSYANDVYGLFSGALVYQNMHDKKLQGYISSESLHIKNNSSLANGMINQYSFKDSLVSNIALDVALSTKKPFTIKLPQLKTEGVGSVTIKGTVQKPLLEGVLAIKKGSLIFPASTLLFSQATIRFTPQQGIDPLIELYAQGRVKKFMVSLAVHGSVYDPHIFLHSVPALSQEHIISLLLTGSEQGSLSMMVPALVMKNFETFLFGSTKRYLKKHSSYSWILKPFEKISFSPYFTDQSGKGGLKGLLEIEISERLRAVLEKKLSLSEDIAVQIEYDLSDDTSLKISKDERGDIGAEVEMRFKF